MPPVLRLLLVLLLLKILPDRSYEHLASRGMLRLGELFDLLKQIIGD